MLACVADRFCPAAPQAVDFSGERGFKLAEIETHAIASTARSLDFGMRLLWFL